MKRIILGTILALAATAALATQTNSGTVCNGNGSCGTTNNYSTTNAPVANGGSATIQSGAVRNEIENRNSNRQGQAQGQQQGQAQGQGQRQSQSAIGSGNSTTITFTHNERLQPGSVAVAATTTTASCRVAVNGGVSFPGGAVGFGSAYLDEQCDKRALGLALIDAARIAHSMGATTEFVAAVYLEGLELLRTSGQSQSAETRSAARPTVPATDAGMNP